MTGALHPGRLRHRRAAGTRRAHRRHDPLCRRRVARRREPAARRRRSRPWPAGVARRAHRARVGPRFARVARDRRSARFGGVCVSRFFRPATNCARVGEALTPGCVYDSNRYTLFAMLRRLNVDPVDLGIVRDDRASLETALRSARRSADVVISSGGVSVGEADFTRELMNRSATSRSGRSRCVRAARSRSAALWSGERAGRRRTGVVLRLAGQSGCRDGDVLPDRARSVAGHVGRDAATRCR